VDDDDVVVMGLQRALAKMNANNPVFVASDGLEALALLRGDASNAPLESPYLILLDLNMPRMNGFEFLDEIRGDPALRRAIVFVLTTSGSDTDKQKAYDRNVAGYIVKSDSARTFDDTLDLLDRYQKIVDLPC
jgi:CheY-like chemotaxis protein